MFTDPFVKCAAEETEQFINRLNQIMPDHGFRQAGLMVLKKQISFYPNATYYDISQADQHPLRTLQVIFTDDQFLICNGSAEEILAFNAQVGLRLDTAHVLDYSRFYLFHVVGPHGKSFVIDTVEDLMLEEEPTPGLRKALNDKIIPFALNASLAGGGYQIRGTLLIEKTLYSVFIDVTPEGRVTAHQARVLAEILPVVNRVLEG